MVFDQKTGYAKNIEGVEMLIVKITVLAVSKTENQQTPKVSKTRPNANNAGRRKR